MRDLKIGDRVMVNIPIDPYHREVGWIVDQLCLGYWRVNLDKHPFPIPVHGGNLLPLVDTPPKEPSATLKIGDRVRVNWPGDKVHGNTGEIVGEGWTHWKVQMDRFGCINLSFTEKQLVLLTDESQTQQQKVHAAVIEEAKFQTAIARMGDDRPAQWDAEAEATFYRLRAYVREG